MPCLMLVQPAWKGASSVWCRLAWLALLAALLTTGRWAAALTLDEQLLQWQHLQERTSYHGSFVYERTGVFSTHEVWRQADGDGHYRERFLRLNGSRLEALRSDGYLDCMARQLPGSPLASVPEPVLLLRKFDLQRMAAGYHTEHVGRGRVAGRDAAILLFTPRDVHRYPLEIHFDLEAGVVLKSLLLNEQGELLERFQFVNLAVGEQPAELLQVADCEPVRTEDRADGEAGPQWQAGWVPEGFVAVSQGPVQQQGISSQLFFDGLAHFSIFVTAVDAGLMDMEHRQLGPTVVISRPVEEGSQRYMITVLGEVPAATAQRIALSVSLSSNGAADD